MEIKFEQSPCRYLRRAADGLQEQEQTLEVRLPESMPDIGRILGAWGSVVIRSKEWRGSDMGIGGGVMTWVLYVPEDGTEPRSVECWLPFQLRWELRDTQNDGFILAMPRLKSVDARSVSARKLMVRANVSVWGAGLDSVQCQLSVPGEMPEDVQLLQRDYPMELPCEAGEKMVQLTEEVDGFTPEAVLRYDIRPVITQRKALTSRIVIRGKALVDILYLQDGKVLTKQLEFPFSQYADLDREYSTAADVQAELVLTNQELEVQEGRLQVKAGFCAQYVIYDRCMVNLVEDAYSTGRQAAPLVEKLQLPARLELREESVTMQQTIHAESEQIVDATLYPEHPQRRQNGDAFELGLGGFCQVLYYDKSGELQCATGRLRQQLQWAAGEDSMMEPRILDAALRVSQGDQMQVEATLTMDVNTIFNGSTDMVVGLDLGEVRKKEEDRPSLILQRYADDTLWELAKVHGSTVAAICRANGLTEEPKAGNMLLIPIP